MCDISNSQLIIIAGSTGVAADFPGNIRWGASPTLQILFDDMETNDQVVSRKYDTHVKTAAFTVKVHRAGTGH